MSWWQWVLIAEFVIMGLVVLVRGANRTTKTYGASDAVLGVIECALLIWLVASR